jgi:hypothetical protein
MNAMTKTSAMSATLDLFNDASAGLDASAVPADDVAARRELFTVHAQAARHVAIYEFKMPEGASVPALNAPGQTRAALDQLHLVVALTGGAIARFPGGLAARVPVKAVARFEALAGPLIEAFLVAYDRPKPAS